MPRRVPTSSHLRLLALDTTIAVLFRLLQFHRMLKPPSTIGVDPFSPFHCRWKRGLSCNRLSTHLATGQSYVTKAPLSALPANFDTSAVSAYTIPTTSTVFTHNADTYNSIVSVDHHSTAHRCCQHDIDHAESTTKTPSFHVAKVSQTLPTDFRRPCH